MTLPGFLPFLAPPPEFWADQFVNGLTTGSLYALIALGYTMVYGVLKMINFAHGEVFMIGSFAGLGILQAFGGNEIEGAMVAVAIAAAIVGAMVVSAATAAAVERIAYRPLRNAPRLAPLISAIGVSIFLQYLFIDRTDAKASFYPEIFPDGSVEIWFFSITYLQSFLIGSSVVMMAFLYTIVQRTAVGRSIRAVSESAQNSSLMGINVNRTIVIVFVLGAAMAAVAGVLFGLFFTTIRGSMGFIPGIKAFTAAVLGGIGSIPGAMVGGYLLGLTETVGRELLARVPGVTALLEALGAEGGLGNQWRDVIAFVVLVLVLIFRPTGIFAERTTRRA